MAKNKGENIQVSVVFTKFENLINDIKNKLRTVDGWSNSEFIEKADQIIGRADEIVNKFTE